LSSIPSSATITSAKLTLFSTTTPLNGDLIHANSGPDNTMLIQRVTGSWSEATTNWANQPGGDAASQIVIPHTTQPFLDLVDIDVTNQVKAMVAGSNNGFLLKLQTEAIYNSRLFYSMKAADTTKRPRLVVQYSN
ncbi:MAG TPA: DNRLRE domain-containing protein, partial [Flavisolibacter sp.]